MSEEKKQKLKEHQKNYRKANRSKTNWFLMNLIVYAMFFLSYIT